MLHLFSILHRLTLSFIFIQTHSCHPESKDTLFHIWWLNLGNEKIFCKNFTFFCIPLVEKNAKNFFLAKFRVSMFRKKIAIAYFRKIHFCENLQNFMKKFARYEVFFRLKPLLNAINCILINTKEVKINNLN